MNTAKLISITTAVGAQGISSLTNFLFVLSLVKYLSAEAFGLYSIAFAVLLMGGGVFHGFFQIQMITRLPERNSSEKVLFACSLFVAQCIFGLVLVLVVLIITVTLNTSYLLVSTAAAILGLSGKEFIIKYIFANGKGESKVVAIQICAAFVFALSVISGYSSSNASSAMASYAGANLLAMSYGVFVARFKFGGLQIVRELREILRDGAWAGFCALVYSLRSVAHTFIVGGTLSLSEAGRMSAARALVTPVSLLIPTMSSIALPHLSRHFQLNGIASVLNQTLFIVSGMILILLAYSVSFYLVWPMLQVVLLGEAYAGLGVVVAGWVVYVLITAIRNTLEWACQAARLFPELLFLNILSAITAIIFVWFLTFQYGVVGAIIGACIAEMVMVCGLSFMLLKQK